MATRAEISALAQAKIAFVEDAIGLAYRYRCRAFASIVPKSAPRPSYEGLRKDYAYLFERLFYYLEDEYSQEQGVIVFDELDKARSHVLLNQMDKYFQHTVTGQQRSARIIPEPFFVHSDLTSMIQLADLVAYLISWAFRFPTMTAPSRAELTGIAQQLAGLRYRTVREIKGNPDFEIWSFVQITDLRGSDDRA
jgi:hypothetical protein